MSVIPSSVGKTASVYSGDHYITATSDSNYLITGTEKAVGSGGYSTLALDASSTLATVGVLNTDKYTAITTSDFTVNSDNQPINVKIYSVPKRFTVTYVRNHDSSDNTSVYYYIDKAVGRASSDIDRAAITYSSNTYTYHDQAIAYPSGWSAPTHKHFSHWDTARDGSGTDYATSADVTGFTDDTVLYAIYADDDQYTINVYFDSNEITSSNVTIS